MGNLFYFNLIRECALLYDYQNEYINYLLKNVSNSIKHFFLQIVRSTILYNLIVIRTYVILKKLN